MSMFVETSITLSWKNLNVSAFRKRGNRIEQKNHMLDLPHDGLERAYMTTVWTIDEDSILVTLCLGNGCFLVFIILCSTQWLVH